MMKRKTDILIICILVITLVPCLAQAKVIITARGAIVRQFTNWFMGATMVFNFTNIGDRDQLSVMNNKWRARFFVGFRL